MKKALRIISVLLVVSILTAMLVSCGGKLSGTWMKGDEQTGVKLEFKGDVVKTTTYMTAFGITSSSSSESHYKVEDGKFITWDIDGSEDDSLSVSFLEGKDDNGKYIEIAGIKYYKQ